MERREFIIGMGAAAGALGLHGCRTCCGSVDQTVVYFGGKIYTANKDQPEATAMVVEEDKIAFVGNDEEALDFAGDLARRIDLNGRRVLPAFVDTHVHSIFYSALRGHGVYELDGEATHEATLEMIRAFAANDKGGSKKPLFFFGFGMQCRPLATELDKIGINRPIFALAMDLHSGWVNTAALKLAKVDKATPDEVPGISYYERDAQGNPTGHIIESVQVASMLIKMRLFTTDDVTRGYRDFVRSYNANGFTTVFDAATFFVDEELGFGAVSRGNEPMRMFASVVGMPWYDTEEFVGWMDLLRDRYESRNFRLTTLKLFKDGTFEQGTALTYRKYEQGVDDGNGVSMMPNDKMLELATACSDAGFSVHVHAIGNRAINETLEMYHELGDIDGTKTIAHIQNVDERGRRLFAENPDVFLSTTPAWFLNSSEEERLMTGILGSAEAHHASYPIGTARRGGSTVVFGSDMPVSASEIPSEDAFIAIEMAVNRGTRENLLKGRNEALTVTEAINAYTIDAARMLQGEDDFGSLEEGKSADFIVLNRDILSIDPRDIASVKVLKTFFRGQCVYTR